jgi:predicted DNA-binding WGR domain protein
MMQYFEFTEENVSCFFEITLENKTVRTRYGQKGTQGIIKEEIFRDANAAAKKYEKLVQEKQEDDAFYFVLGDAYRL